MSTITIPTSLTSEQIEKVESLISSFTTPKWEPSTHYSDYQISLTHAIHGVRNSSVTGFRNTETLKQCYEQLKAQQRLLAYVQEFDNDYTPDWPHTTKKWFIVFDFDENKWRESCVQYSKNPTTVYMSRKCANELANKLNAGEVVL